MNQVVPGQVWVSQSPSGIVPHEQWRWEVRWVSYDRCEVQCINDGRKFQTDIALLLKHTKRET